MLEYTVKVDNGTKYWYLNGNLHREDGPAVEYSDGSKAWYLNGKCHREDGPAVEYSDGSKAWYLNGKQLSKNEFEKRTSSSCQGKIVEIDGRRYKLMEKKSLNERFLNSLIDWVHTYTKRRN